MGSEESGLDINKFIDDAIEEVVEEAANELGIDETPCTTSPIPPSRHVEGLGFEAIGDKVIAEIVPIGKSLGGIDLPADSSYAEMPRYKIVSVGDGFLTMDGGKVPLNVEPGDLILQAGKIRKYEFAGVKYILLPYGEIFSIVRKGQAT